VLYFGCLPPVNAAASPVRASHTEFPGEGITRGELSLRTVFGRRLSFILPRIVGEERLRLRPCRRVAVAGHRAARRSAAEESNACSAGGCATPGAARYVTGIGPG